MSKHAESDSRKSSIIGMDVFTPHVPDLRSFNHTLVTGRMRIDNVQPVEEPGLQSTRQDGSEKFQSWIPLVIRRAIDDTGWERKIFSGVNIGVVLHFSPYLEEEQISVGPIWVEQVKQRLFEFGIASPAVMDTISAGRTFDQALERAQALLDTRSCDYAALCGIFTYSMPGTSPAENAAVPGVRAAHTAGVLGAGCMLLSNPGANGKPYADLIWERAEFTRENKNDPHLLAAGPGKYLQGNFRDQTSETQIELNPAATRVLDSPVYSVEQQVERSQDLPTFFQIPMIRVMRSALSLNSKTHFSDFDEIKLEGGDLSESTHTPIRPYFLPPYREKRESEALITQTAMVWLQKDAGAEGHPDRPFSNLGLYLLPVDLNDGGQIESVLSDLEKEITTCHDLNSFASAAVSRFRENRTGTRTLVLLGKTRQDFVRELAHARAGVEKANREGVNWQTPAGSFYTPNPLGKRGKIAFVYPGAFGTYVGMGREIFYLFPELHNALEEITDDPGRTINEAVIFPPDSSPEKFIQQQDELDRSPTRMISSGICFSYLFTSILRDIFKVQPQAAFGYSLGEISMMFAMGIWSQANAMRTSLEVSPVFQERVSGPQNAIREFWNLPAAAGEQEESRPLWSNLVLLAPLEKVKNAVEVEDRVYITHINAPRQVVIGGDPGACQRVVSGLNCMHLETPYHHAIHCPPVMSEFDHFLRLHDWPVEQQPEIPVYSAADYSALEYDPKSVAENFARMLTQPIVFPRLVDLAYQDGARIFIELGAGSNCSKWVESTLKGSPHASFSINASQVSDHVSILALLARLISHQVPLELGALIRQ